jgi:hypothetical protein
LSRIVLGTETKRSQFSGHACALVNGALGVEFGRHISSTDEFVRKASSFQCL